MHPGRILSRASHGPRALLHSLHQLLILHRQLCQLFAHSLVDVQVLGDTAVQAHRLALGQFCFLVVGRHTLPVAGTGHSGAKEGQS